MGQLRRSISFFAMVFSPLAGAQNIATGILQALSDGELDLGLRYRYEIADEDAFDRNAYASTLRTRLAYTSDTVEGFSVTLNVDDVRAIGANNYDSTRNAKTQYPRIPDPEGIDLNLVSIAYAGLEKTTIVVGRQRILLDNGRFVSGLPWRQNETTYDAASVTYALNHRLSIFYSYVDRVNRAFGPDSGLPSKTFGGPINLFDATYTLSPLFRITGYGYWLNLSNAPEAPLFSTRTLGTRISGVYEFTNPWSLTYAGEYAHQTGIGANPKSSGADYYGIEIGLRRDRFSIRAAYEHLGGSNVPGEAFTLPLGRKHPFQGWADKFLMTPQGGVEDFYIAADAVFLKGQLTFGYHDFSAAIDGSSYGDELDMSLAWTFSDRYELLVGFAHYDASGFSTDTDKVWLMLSRSF
jgi:hypothetical protein